MPKVYPSHLATQSDPLVLCSLDTFWDAVKVGDVTAIDALYFTNEHLGARNSDGLNALHIAVIEQKEAMVRWLLLQGCALEVRAIYDWTALHLAAQRFSPVILRDLLLAGATGIVHDKAGWTPLHIAVSKSNLPFMQLLMLSFPKLVNQADFNGWTPLHLAASGQRMEMLQLLIKEGAKFESLTLQDETPFDLANSNSQQTDVALWLRETRQRHQQLKQFLEQENLIATLKLHNEQLQSEVAELRAIIGHKQANITQLEQEASTLQDKVIHRLSIFQTNQTNLTQEDTQHHTEQGNSHEGILEGSTVKSSEMEIDEKLENIQAPHSPSMLL